MIDSALNSTILTIDTKKYRLRIHKAAIHQIGDPKLIQLLINPQGKQIAIRGADHPSTKRDQIKVERQMKDVDDSVEMYSKHLITKLLASFPELQTGCCYNLSGHVIAAEMLAVFPLDTVTIIDNEEGEQNVKHEQAADY